MNQLNRVLLVCFAITLATVLAGYRTGYAQESAVDNSVMVSSGFMFACAVTEEDSVKCWGSNEYGQLGDGGGGDTCDDEPDEVCRSTPVDVVGLSDVNSVAAGGSHACALLNNGNVKCWGSNSSGQLGNGTTDDSSTPVRVKGLSGPVKSLDIGSATCALLISGDVECWGYNVGPTPTKVSGLGPHVKRVTSGGGHNCALTKQGGVKCWGRGEYGELGDGSDAGSGTPVDVVGLDKGVVAIAAGDDHTCAVLDTGRVKCWGLNESFGSIGTGSFDGTNSCDGQRCYLAPADVVSLEGALDISTVSNHSCARLSDDSIRCWGNNVRGQLGNFGQGAACNYKGTCSPTPVEVEGLPGKAMSVSSGYDHTCAVIEGGGLVCWGSNEEGQLGIGFGPWDVKKPTTIDGFGATVLSMDLGSAHSCVLLDDGTIECFGQNDEMQLGDGTIANRYEPRAVKGLSESAKYVSAGYDAGCAVTASGGVECWGNVPGVDNGAPNDGVAPVAIPGLESNVSIVKTFEGANDGHGCAVLRSGDVKCWGENGSGELGDGTGSDSDSAVDVVGLGGKAIEVVVGMYHTCALLDTGKVMCWGGNDWGELGIGPGSGSNVPVHLKDLNSKTIAIAGTRRTTCALLDNGSVECWGSNYSGQIGDGTMGYDKNRFKPTPVKGLNTKAISITSSGNHNCVILQGGDVQCWGLNDYRQLGDGGGGVKCDGDECRPLPVDVKGLTEKAVTIDAGGRHTCAILDDDSMQCWGDSRFGQAGDQFVWRSIPDYVAGYRPINNENGVFLPAILR